MRVRPSGRVPSVNKGGGGVLSTLLAVEEHFSVRAILRDTRVVETGMEPTQIGVAWRFEGFEEKSARRCQLCYWAAHTAVSRAIRTALFRPILTWNRLHTFAAQVINDGRQNKPSIKLQPGDGGNPKTAEVKEGRASTKQYPASDLSYFFALGSKVTLNWFSIGRIQMYCFHLGAFAHSVVTR